MLTNPDLFATVVVAAYALAGAAAILAGPIAWRRHGRPRRVSLLARYRRGRHQAARTPWLARLADAYLAGAREYAAASALLRGDTVHAA